MNVRIRRVGLAVVLGAVPVLIGTAPNASAAVTGVTVEQPAEGLRTGCVYTVTVDVDAPVSEAGEVTVGISGGPVPGTGERLGVAVYHPESGTATFEWTPAYVGRQNVFAQQFKPGQVTSARYVTVDVVGRGVNTGSSCLPLP
ncbi:hypothetical protein IU433_17620 [Nocardia puris]|uniref:Ig-like domain-containing protein n=1 Tax=Nocardia puris TaxID=208602 RepID=A0A366D637_9NOCA|nr:hypothetical protein [Nocardia puris]MBF6212263.1 hypothetical protein [Nocardia puris]MBF6366510.1 hypothetical protein [Nocardia puris]MBF6460852.1 hypothetical protein [Nocardia puris]RBO85497.1 hypothetical protein DFR74_11437 [Nocardia puris]